jgi:hypothetical protein
MSDRKLELRRERLWGLRYADPTTGKIRWKTLGTLPEMSEELARVECHKFLATLATDLPVPTCTLSEFVEKVYFPITEEIRCEDTTASGRTYQRP